MESLFNAEDQKSDNMLKFQQTTEGQDESSLIPVYEGMLSTKRAENDLIQLKATVFSDRIIYSELKGDSTPKWLSIKWKRLIPFFEELNEDTAFGFKMWGAGQVYEFYVEDESKMEKWLDILTPLMITEDIEEDYIIQEKLGEGYFASVYKAQRRVDGLFFAVKSIQKQKLIRGNDVSSLIKEIDTLRRIKHESALRLHCVYEDQSHVHLITSLASGEWLFTRVLQRKKFSEKMASCLMLNFLKALDYLHSQRIAHRDIKLENILMLDNEDDSKILLADFGLASEVDGAYLQSKCGSPGYMAPELIHGPDYGTKVDIFSAGIILYVILSGIPAYPGRNEDQIIRKNIKGNIYYPEKYWKKVSQEAVDLVLKMTEYDPTQRPSAAVCLQHPWFIQNHPDMTPITRHVAIDAKLPMPKPGPKVTSRLMAKMNQIKNHWQSLPASDAKNMKALLDIDEEDPSKVRKMLKNKPATVYHIQDFEEELKRDT